MSDTVKAKDKFRWVGPHDPDPEFAGMVRSVWRVLFIGLGGHCAIAANGFPPCWAYPMAMLLDRKYWERIA